MSVTGGISAEDVSIYEGDAALFEGQVYADISGSSVGVPDIPFTISHETNSIATGTTNGSGSYSVSADWYSLSAAGISTGSYSFTVATDRTEFDY